MILEIKGSSNIGCNFKGVFWNHFAILQESEKLLNLIVRLHSSLIGFDKTREHLSENNTRDHLYLQLYPRLF